MSRLQVGIERLARVSNEQRESMNCKSCRKRKIKCNRLRPTCEQCQIFKCACIYDAVPKKRGPKTDVLEALLKRVDGLEQQLKDERRTALSDDGEVLPAQQVQDQDTSGVASSERRSALPEDALRSPSTMTELLPPVNVPTEVLIDTYFVKTHGRPYYIFDERTVRHRIAMNELPTYLLQSIYAVAARYVPHPGGHHETARMSEEYAMRARAAMDVDEPSIDCLQALLLIVLAFMAAGKSKKAYMLLTSAIGMAMALSLHRESNDFDSELPLAEREIRRRLFWTCYLLDRYSACGSRRPSLISDTCIFLRLPSWSTAGGMPVEGESFQSAPNLQHGPRSRGSSEMLIDISRILGTTNRYLAAGGVKGDSHFPWHSLSNLSRIRNDLDIWASGTQDVFSSVETLFGQPDSTTLVLSKLIYHLIHCLIYRPFLPIDLSELAGTGQHQSWQIEATYLCFLHADAIAELVELGKQSPSVEYPALVGYCIFTAGTVHVHGAHYKSASSPFSTAAEFLTREMQQLSTLQHLWSLLGHQRDMLQAIHNCHSELIQSLGGNAMRFSSAFHLEDFFDRYGDLGVTFDAAHLNFESICSAISTRSPGHTFHPSRSMSELRAGKRKHPGITSSGRGKEHNVQSQRQIDGSPDHPKHYNNSPNAIDQGSMFPSRTQDHASQFPFQDHNPGRHTVSGQGSAKQWAQSAPRPVGPASGQGGMSFSPVSRPAREGFDAMYGMELGTPGAESAGTHESERDPFLSLLEQLAENEGRGDGAGDLDFFLAGNGG